MSSQEYHLAQVFKALSDPNRLRIFDLLTFNDLSNSELMTAIGLSQNLLSHHFSVLMEAGLVEVHPSIGDARRRYYSANLDAVAGVRGWFTHHMADPRRPLPALSPRRRVLFLCLRNSARSLMAEAIARHIAPDALEASSAGLEHDESPQLLLAFQVLAEHGIPVDGLRQRTLAELPPEPLDTVITVCDLVHERIDRTRLHASEYLHWSLVDPSTLASDHKGQLAATRQLYRRLEQRITVFVQHLSERDNHTPLA